VPNGRCPSMASENDGLESTAHGPSGRSGSQVARDCVRRTPNGYRVVLEAASLHHLDALAASLARAVGGLVLCEVNEEPSAVRSEVAAIVCGFGVLVANGAAVWSKTPARQPLDAGGLGVHSRTGPRRLWQLVSSAQVGPCDTARRVRPLDQNEALYVGQKWRELQIVNRILTIGAVVICLLSLAAASVAFWLAFRGGVANAIAGLVVALMMLGMAFGFGFILFVRARVSGAPEPASTIAVMIEGPFWEEGSARSMTRHGIGDTYVSAPPHWLPLLRRAGASRELTAEVVEGPAEMSILLSVNGVLSVSDDVAHGLLSVRDPLLPVFALLAVVGFIAAAIVAAASYDSDLTLWRYLKVGPVPARFSSVAELQRAQPVAFGYVQLADVTLARAGRKAQAARDQPPAEVGEAVRLTREAERIRDEIRDDPCAETTATCSGDEHERHAETRARAATKVIEDGADWVGRLEATGQEEFAVRGARDLAPDLEKVLASLRDARRALGNASDRAKRQQERVDEQSAFVLQLAGAGRRDFDMRPMAVEAARKAVSHEAEADLAQTLQGAATEIADTARAVAARHTLEGILYRRPSGEAWLAVGAGYSTFALRAQAAAWAFGFTSAVLALLSVGTFIRRNRVLRALAARLPRSL
jgi:hypothetical protein